MTPLKSLPFIVPHKPKGQKVWPKIQQRLPERKRMTIGIGFVCSDGLVIAADTQESYGDDKAYVQKVVHYKQEHCKLVIAGAGVGQLIDHAVTDIGDIAIEHPETSKAFMKDLMISMRRIYEHDFKHYPLQEEQKIIQLLVGFQVRNEPAQLLYVNSTLVNPVEGVKGIGFGALLHEDASEIYSVIDQLKFNVQQTMWPALYIVHEAKKRFTTVGGTKTAAIGLSHSGHLSFEREFDQAQREQVFDCLRRASYLQLLCVEPTISDKDAKDLLMNAENMILRAREMHQKIHREHLALLEYIKKQEGA